MNPPACCSACKAHVASLTELFRAVARSADGAQDVDGKPLLSAAEATRRLVGLAVYADALEAELPTTPPAPAPPTIPTGHLDDDDPAIGDAHVIPEGRGWTP